MKITDLFIRRPVLATCLNLLLLVGGYQAIQALNVRQYPKSDLAVITIKTVYVGATADLVRGYITTPLERVIASADGIDYLESTSAQGISTINAHLRLNFDANSALTQIQSKVSQVRNDLPPEAEVPTIDLETADNRFASMYLSFYSEDLQPNQITDYLLRTIQPKLSAVPGVQKADILGARTFAMRIWLKPEKLAAHGLTSSDVRDALSKNNFLSAVGNTKGSMISVNLLANTDLKSKAEFENLIVQQDGNTLIRLRDVSDVILGAENYDEDVRFSGQKATFMGIWVLPNANSLDVISNVRKLIPEIEVNLPSGMKVGVPYDGTAYIQDAIHEVISTLIETIVIVIVVIYLFIGSLRSVIIPVVAIPLSLIGATMFMLAFGFTINLLTLLAIVLAVGLVVDDAIVMLENIERHVKLGLRPMDAALKGARELVGPTIAMTITLAAVYAPIGFQGGLTGALFKEFAFTLAGAVIISGFVALTLTPMMASKILKANDRPNWFQQKVTHVFDALRLRYSSILRGALSYRAAVLTGALLIMFCIPPFYMFSMKELAPKEDQGVVFGIVQAAPNSSIEQTAMYTDEMYKIFTTVPEYWKTFQLTNPSGGFSGIITKPWSERTRTTQEIEGELWGKMSVIPGIRAIMTTPPALPGGSDFQIEFVISSTSPPDQIVGFAEQLVGKAFASGVFMFADTDLKYDLPQSEIILDRDKISSLGLDLEKIGQELGTFTGGNYVNRFNIQGRSYKVIPQLKRQERLNPEQLSDLYVSGANGALVPLSTFASIEQKVDARSLNRFQQLNSAKIQGAIPPGVTVDQALTVLEEEAKKILPPGYAIDYAGESRQLRKEQNALTGTLILATFLIFLVLASQFESFRDPLIILAGSVPLALAGALSFVFLDFTSLNIYSQVGLVTLIGLVAKNGILIVEFANHLQAEGRSKYEAVIEAATTRLRPVLMTTTATIVGHFPLVIATGAGAGARNSIGIVLVTGMFIGTLFTLFVVPAIYTLIAGDHSKHEDAEEALIEEDEDQSHERYAMAN
jgi:multidrug efflux pump